MDGPQQQLSLPHFADYSFSTFAFIRKEKISTIKRLFLKFCRLATFNRCKRKIQKEKRFDHFESRLLSSRILLGSHMPDIVQLVLIF
jgi:hypothetical protein